MRLGLWISRGQLVLDIAFEFALQKFYLAAAHLSPILLVAKCGLHKVLAFHIVLLSFVNDNVGLLELVRREGVLLVLVAVGQQVELLLGQVLLHLFGEGPFGIARVVHLSSTRAGRGLHQRLRARLIIVGSSGRCLHDVLRRWIADGQSLSHHVVLVMIQVTHGLLVSTILRQIRVLRSPLLRAL